MAFLESFFPTKMTLKISNWELLNVKAASRHIPYAQDTCIGNVDLALSLLLVGITATTDSD